MKSELIKLVSSFELEIVSFVIFFLYVISFYINLKTAPKVEGYDTRKQNLINGIATIISVILGIISIPAVLISIYRVADRIF